MAKNVVCRGDCSMWAWDEGAFCSCWINYYRCSLYPADRWCWVQPGPYWLPACWTCPFLREELTSPHTTVDSFVFSSFCLTCVDALWADTYQSRRFPGELTPFPLCSALSVTHNSPTLKSALSDINAAAPVFFRLVLSWNIFLHTFTFTLYTSLYLKWFLVAVI